MGGQPKTPSAFIFTWIVHFFIHIHLDNSSVVQVTKTSCRSTRMTSSRTLNWWDESSTKHSLFSVVPLLRLFVRPRPFFGVKRVIVWLISFADWRGLVARLVQGPLWPLPCQLRPTSTTVIRESKGKSIHMKTQVFTPRRTGPLSHCGLCFLRQTTLNTTSSVRSNFPSSFHLLLSRSIRETSQPFNPRLYQRVEVKLPRVKRWLPGFLFTSVFAEPWTSHGVPAIACCRLFSQC